MAGMISDKDTKITFDVYSRCFDEIEKISDEHLNIAIKNILPIIRFWELETKFKDEQHKNEFDLADGPDSKLFVHIKDRDRMIYNKSTLDILKLARKTMIEERKKRK